MKDFNKAQVQNELTRRWGEAAYAEYSPKAPLKDERNLLRTLYHPATKEASRHAVADRRFMYRCQVGYISNVVFRAFHVLGSGDTWREAFADADARIAKSSRAA